MNGAGIELDNVTKRYGKAVVAVRSLSLRVEPGEVFSLLGTSGCGKTTTLRLIAGFERPEEGALAIGGRVVDDGTEVYLGPEERSVGFVFKGLRFVPASECPFERRVRAPDARGSSLSVASCSRGFATPRSGAHACSPRERPVEHRRSRPPTRPTADDCQWWWRS